MHVAALDKMKRMREQAVFTWQLPMAEGSVLFKLRSWNALIEQFIAGTEITKYFDIISFTYTHDSNFNEISNYPNVWKDIYICTEHGLAFCFKKQFLKVLEEIHVPTTIDTLALILGIKLEHTLLL